jgi:hypothetical protein
MTGHSQDCGTRTVPEYALRAEQSLCIPSDRQDVVEAPAVGGSINRRTAIMNMLVTAASVAAAPAVASPLAHPDAELLGLREQLEDVIRGWRTHRDAPAFSGAAS